MQAVKSVTHATLKYKNYILTTPSIVYYFAHIAEECLYAVYFWKTGKVDAAYQWIALNNIIGCGRENNRNREKEQKTCKNIVLEKCEWIFKKVYEWKIGWLT